MIHTERSSRALLVARMCVSGVAFLQLLVVSLVLLNLDFANASDPNVRVYTTIRWRLLTIWFNMIALFYHPVCIFCDWMEMNGQWKNKRTRIMRKIRDVTFTVILLPLTMYCDTLFWRTWLKDPAIIAPLRIFDYLPYWSHHSLHTVSGVVVLLDLIMVPRRRPHSILPGVIIITLFTLVYTAMVAVSYANGIVVYAVLNMFTKYQIWLLILMSFLEILFFYTFQWCIVDIVWGRKPERIKKITNE